MVPPVTFGVVWVISISCSCGAVPEGIGMVQVTRPVVWLTEPQLPVGSPVRPGIETAGAPTPLPASAGQVISTLVPGGPEAGAPEQPASAPATSLTVISVSAISQPVAPAGRVELPPHSPSLSLGGNKVLSNSASQTKAS